MKKLLVSGLLSLSMVLSACAAGKAEEKPSEAMAPKDSMQPKDTMMMAGPAKGFYSAEGLGPQVVNFSSEKAVLELAKTSNVVYYFAATWCPSCQAGYKDLQANYKMLPKDVTVVLIDYDNSSDLKKRYGVTMQHTFVQIDKTGAKSKIWSGGGVKEIIEKASMAAM